MSNIKKLLFVLMVVLFTACGTSTMDWKEKYDIGMRYLTEGNYEEAILSFTAAIEIDDKVPEVYVGMADAYIGLDEYKEAIEILREGMEKTDNNNIISEKLEYLERNGGVQEGQVVSGNLQLSNITYYYEDGKQVDEWDESVIGGINLDFTVNGPANVVDVPGLITNSDIPFSQDEINSLFEYMKGEEEKYTDNKGPVPFETSLIYSVEKSERGKTQYILLFGADSNGDYVGYSEVVLQIP